MEPQKSEIFTYIAIPINASQISAACLNEMKIQDKLFIVSSQESGSANKEVVETIKLVQSKENHENNDSSVTTNINTTVQDVTNNNQAIEQSKKPVEPKSQFAQCKVCDEVMKLSKYKRHMAEHRNKKYYNCEECKEGFNVEENLKLHMSLHSKGDPHCPVCDRKFQRYASLKAHLVVHQVEETHNCYECSAEFDKEEDYLKHLEEHKSDIITINNEKEPEYTCPHCKYTFANITEYKEHLSMHSKISKMIYSKKSKKKTKGVKVNHKCDICGKTFTKENSLERHLRIHSGEKPFVCSHCSKGFTQRYSLVIHMACHTGIKPYECMLCSAKFAQKGNLKVHVEKTHLALLAGEKVYKCIHCTCIFRTVAALNGHITKFHSDNQKNEERSTENQQICTNKQINKKENVSFISVVAKSENGEIRKYKIKQRKCGDIRYNLCDLCPKEFKKPSDLLRHIRTHTNEKPFKCNMCLASFALKSTLEAHMNSHTGVKNYECEICHKRFPNLKTLNTHYKRHDKNLRAEHTKQFKCSECDKFFITMAQANEHLKIHNLSEEDGANLPENKQKENELKNNDTIGTKRPLDNSENSAYQYVPKPHSATEDLEELKNRPFNCHVCNQSFLKSDHMKQHMLRHSGLRQYVCSMCSKSFYTASNLKEHLKTHSVTRNYSCKICSLKFKTNTTLKRHMQMHNANKPFMCSYCNKNFRTILLCKKHMSTHMKEQAENENAAITININEMLNNADNNDDVQQKNQAESTVENIQRDNLDFKKLLPEENADLDITKRKFIKRKIITENGEINEEDKDSFFSGNISLPRGDPPPYDKVANTMIDPNQFINMENSEKPANEENPNYYQTIYINYDDLQNNLGALNLYNTLLPQLKLPNNDSLLLNDFQESSNMLFPLETSLSITEPTENSSVTFNSPTATQSENSVTISIPEDQETAQQSVLATKGNENSENSKVIDTSDSTDNTKIINIDQFSFCQRCKCLLENKHVCADISKIILEKTDPLKNVYLTKPLESKRKRKQIIRRGQNNFQCTECDKSFASKASVAKHRRKHTMKGRIQENICSFCEKKFKKKSDLERHVRTHTGEKPYSCEQCCKSFSLKSTLQSHMKTHMPGGRKEYKCHICHSYFSSKNSLKVHYNIHTDSKPHQCPLCPQKFRTRASKNIHVKAHSRNTIRKANKPNILKQTKTSILETLIPTISTIETTDAAQNIEDFFNNSNIANQVEIQENNSIENIQIVPFLYNQPLQANIILQEENMEYPISFGIDNETVNQIISIPTLQEVDSNGLTINTLDTNVLLEPKMQSLLQNIQFKKQEIQTTFKCEKCLKFFTNQNEFQRHLSLHIDNRVFTCNFCYMSFTGENNLKTHLKGIHNV